VKATVLAIANKKGGVGKSTVAVNLAAELGARGYRVLVADTDPQGHAGLGLGVGAVDQSRSIHAAFRGPQVDLTPLICATTVHGVDVLAADRNFDGRVGEEDPRRLARALDPLRPLYNVILVDTPPAAAPIAVCVLLASDGVIVPTALDHLSLDGVRQIRTVVSPCRNAAARGAPRHRRCAHGGRFAQQYAEARSCQSAARLRRPPGPARRPHRCERGRGVRAAATVARILF
jgi:cellulose biosynthesis protein BcsQ